MTIAEQLIQAKADLDAVYEAGKAAGGVERRMEWTTDIVTEDIGDTVVILGQYAKLAEIRNEATLFVRAECDNSPTPYTIIKNWASNDGNGSLLGTSLQNTLRYDPNGNIGHGSVVVPLNTESVGGVGQLRITEDGKLLFYHGSMNYRIRPCKCKIIVEW